MLHTLVPGVIIIQVPVTSFTQTSTVHFKSKTKTMDKGGFTKWNIFFNLTLIQTLPMHSH